MSDYAVQVSGLTRRFGARVAVQDLNLGVTAGSVYGFLGPNGAGKTTAMRCILGLIRADAGQVAIFGETHPVKRRAGVGALIETPRFYDWLSGRENLKISCAYAGVDPKAQVEAVLDRVGLRDRGDDRVRGYSLGMKQRLGIARALLGSPRLLILDEPSNGLDPQGMKQVRDLLRSLARDDGLTILISSHLLYEVESVATRVGILRSGRLVAEGDVSELLGGGEQIEVEVHSTQPQALQAAVQTIPGAELLHMHDDDANRARLRLEGMDTAQLNQQLVAAGVPVAELINRGRTLEDLFLALTGDGVIS